MNLQKVPFSFRLYTGLTGLVISLVFPVWVRDMMLTFGAHTKSVILLLVAICISLSFTCLLSGKLADRSKRSLWIILVYLVMIILFVIFQSEIFSWVTRKYLKIIQAYNPGDLGIGLLKLILSSGFFLIPSLTAGLIPLLVKHNIKNIALSGRYMSAVLISLSLGTLTGVLVSAFLLVPRWHMNALLFAAGFVLVVLVLLTAISIFRHEPSTDTAENINADQTNIKKIRFRKKKIVLETGIKLTRAMLYSSVFQAFSFSSMIILCYRILSKYNYIKPVFFFGIVLGLVLAGILLGSLLYKQIADKPANKYLTLATLQMAGGFAALLSYGFLHVFALKIYNGLPGAGSFAILFFRQTALFSILLFLPSILYGVTFPLAGRLYPKRLQQIGSNFGKLMNLVFLSMAAGLLITPFVFIPFAGIELSFIILSMLIVLSGIYLLLRDSRLIRGFRLGFGFTVLLLFSAVAATVYVITLTRRNFEERRIIEGSTASVSTVIAEDKKMIYLNGNYYFGTDPDGYREQVLAASVPAFIQPKIKTTLIMGFGTGITASLLDQYGAGKIIIAESFPEIIRMSSDIFAVENKDILTESNVDINIEDARSYLFRSPFQFDLITTGANYVFMYPGSFTAEFYQLCRQKLNTGGILCQSISLEELTLDEFRAVINARFSVFANTTLWYVAPQKVLLISSLDDYAFSYCESVNVFNALNRDHILTGIDINNAASLIAHLVVPQSVLKEFAGDVMQNADRSPFIEFNPGIRDPNEIRSHLPKNDGDVHSVRFSGNCTEDSTAVISSIKRLNQSLMRQDEQPSLLQRRNVVDFYEATDSLTLRYL